LPLTRQVPSLRPSPDKGRTGGVRSGGIRALCMICSANPPSIPPCQGGSREPLHGGCQSSPSLTYF
jgi:hypothetical protein